MVYFDTSYLVRLYIADEGFDSVRSLAGTTQVASSFHGEIETIAALHRVYRESRISRGDYLVLLDQFQNDSMNGAFNWLSAGNELVPKLEQVYRGASAKFFLRSGDALHLACARANGFTEICSNDSRMLAAAPAFGLKARNVIK